MNAVLQFEQSPLVLIAASALRAMLRLAILAVWALLVGAGAIISLWRPVAMVLGLVATVLLCVVCPTLPVALAIITAFGWVTYPRTAVRANVSWNKGREVRSC